VDRIIRYEYFVAFFRWYVAGSLEDQVPRGSEYESTTLEWGILSSLQVAYAKWPQNVSKKGPLGRRRSPPHQIVRGFEEECNLGKRWKSLPSCKEERARNGLKELDLY
jgi:hypothetical protein